MTDISLKKTLESLDTKIEGLSKDFEEQKELVTKQLGDLDKKIDKVAEMIFFEPYLDIRYKYCADSNRTECVLIDRELLLYREYAVQTCCQFIYDTLAYWSNKYQDNDYMKAKSFQISYSIIGSSSTNKIQISLGEFDLYINSTNIKEKLDPKSQVYTTIKKAFYKEFDYINCYVRGYNMYSNNSVISSIKCIDNNDCDNPESAKFLSQHIFLT